MSNEEKLRSLLAEAREFVNDCDLSQSGVYCVCRTCDIAKTTRQRIDAALAEPVPAPWEQRGVADDRMIAALREARRDRDEAREEAERLWKRLEHVDSDLQLAVKRLTTEVERLRGAYQRGAEAMREAAAGTIEAKVSNPYINRRMAEEIRTLPVPENKP